MSEVRKIESRCETWCEKRGTSQLNGEQRAMHSTKKHKSERSGDDVSKPIQAASPASSHNRFVLILCYRSAQRALSVVSVL